MPKAKAHTERLRNLALLIKGLERAAEITLACEPEVIPYKGNASAIDPVTDRETEEWIRSELERDNNWAWCTAVVTVTYGEHTATHAIGGCSYESAAAFKAPGGYYDDLVGECICEIADEIMYAAEERDLLIARGRKRK